MSWIKEALQRGIKKSSLAKEEKDRRRKEERTPEEWEKLAIEQERLRVDRFKTEQLLIGSPERKIADKTILLWLNALDQILEEAKKNGFEVLLGDNVVVQENYEQYHKGKSTLKAPTDYLILDEASELQVVKSGVHNVGGGYDWSGDDEIWQERVPYVEQVSVVYVGRPKLERAIPVCTITIQPSIGESRVTPGFATIRSNRDEVFRGLPTQKAIQMIQNNLAEAIESSSERIVSAENERTGINMLLATVFKFLK
ncbi:hypothetical protein H3C66_00015 [Patescibacteria group bacterium]|nr:hypothetical protein [Patescibacteria group bacterium]